jgi:hypothetical protein
MSWHFSSACPVRTVPFRMYICTVASRSFSGRPLILEVLSWQPCPGNPFLAALPWHSFRGSSVLAVLLCLSSLVGPVCLSCSACSVMPVLFCLFCFACPVLIFPFCKSCFAYPVLPVLFCLSRSTVAVQFLISCSACSVLPDSFWMFCSAFLFCLPCSTCPVLSVLFYLSCSACPVLPVLFCLSWQFCPGSPLLPAILFWQQSVLKSTKGNRERKRKPTGPQKRNWSAKVQARKNNKHESQKNAKGFHPRARKRKREDQKSAHTHYLRRKATFSSSQSHKIGETICYSYWTAGVTFLSLLIGHWTCSRAGFLDIIL